ncbi:3-deoxy-D-manno-octulosonic acid kinase [Shewanella submarina]|uniref:3-deoxy-D-manno-octulosonic acid kinase n=1 Tax=Shewanella submarina TaxID=2016376 RepID=A0ABV7GFN5_9GAMM|nr:3-deoxy-D-manno-octulosonic acid kinase [Shewanella submarina]MCL1038773.1 3-deoxy-D-manno-octulosonic acid kinase [Shewanella submarina]
MPSELKTLPLTAGSHADSSQVNGWLVLASDLDGVTSDWFDSEFWQQQDAIEGTSKGRYTTWFIHYQPQQADEHWVLRHYWRGGLMAKLSKDTYFYTGLERTRPAAELKLLDILYKEGFPVPRPIAAQIRKQGLGYSGDILIERIQGAKDLVAVLSEQEMGEQQWQALGECIAQFHNRGVFHADLNAKNILLSPEGFHLIDFDRGAIRPVAHHWQASNLDRLHRSFKKEQGKFPQLTFTEENWMSLLKGYNGTNRANSRVSRH